MGQQIPVVMGKTSKSEALRTPWNQLSRLSHCPTIALCVSVVKHGCFVCYDLVRGSQNETGQQWDSTGTTDRSVGCPMSGNNHQIVRSLVIE
jgi:hypothetical protein